MNVRTGAIVTRYITLLRPYRDCSAGTLDAPPPPVPTPARIPPTTTGITRGPTIPASGTSPLPPTAPRARRISPRLTSTPLPPAEPGTRRVSPIFIPATFAAHASVTQVPKAGKHAIKRCRYHFHPAYTCNRGDACWFSHEDTSPSHNPKKGQPSGFWRQWDSVESSACLHPTPPQRLPDSVPIDIRVHDACDPRPFRR